MLTSRKVLVSLLENRMAEMIAKRMKSVLAATNAGKRAGQILDSFFIIYKINRAMQRASESGVLYLESSFIPVK